MQRLSETLEILRGLWTGEAIDYDGEWFQLEAARQMPTPLTKIPIVIGGTGPKDDGARRRARRLVERADPPARPARRDARPSAGDARVSVQQMYAFVPEGADRAAIEEPARRRFGYRPSSSVVASEMLDHFHAMRERGVERFYVWFTDFAPPATLEAFGAEVISAFD